jgi:predicted ATPase
VWSGQCAALTIPATLHDALMARLDRLGPSKAVAQLGAVLGRTFAYAVLHAVAPWEETTLLGVQTLRTVRAVRGVRWSCTGTLPRRSPGSPRSAGSATHG